MSDGSVGNPFHNLKTALQNSLLKAGQTVYLRNGTHLLTADIAIAANNITLKSYPGENAVIDFQTSDIAVNGNNIRFENLELMSSDTNRQSAFNGDVLPDILRGSLNVYGANFEMVGCRLHDLASFGFWGDGAGGLVDSCDLYNFGALQLSGEGWNHLCYTQNSSGIKTIRNCIFGQTFAFGIHAYEIVNTLVGYRVENCILSHARQLFGGLNGADDIQLNNCATWACSPQFGYANNINGAMSIGNSYCVGGATWFQVDNWADVDIQNNVFISSGSRQAVYYKHSSPIEIWNNNTYRGTNSFELSPSIYNFSAWQALGYDASSNFNASLPTTSIIKIIPCNSGRRVAHIAVYNWQNDTNVSIDLSSLGLANGNYNLRNAYDPLNDIRAITYTGSPINVDMTTRTIVKPIGHATALATVDNKFGAWILEAA